MLEALKAAHGQLGSGVSEYPEHDKLREVQASSQAIGDFIEWLANQGLWICEHRDTFGGEWVPTRKSRDRLLAEHFEIDTDALEAESRAILAGKP